MSIPDRDELFPEIARPTRSLSLFFFFKPPSKTCELLSVHTASLVFSTTLQQGSISNLISAGGRKEDYKAAVVQV